MLFFLKQALLFFSFLWTEEHHFFERHQTAFLWILRHHLFRGFSFFRESPFFCERHRTAPNGTERHRTPCLFQKKMVRFWRTAQKGRRCGSKQHLLAGVSCFKKKDTRRTPFLLFFSERFFRNYITMVYRRTEEHQWCCSSVLLETTERFFSLFLNHWCSFFCSSSSKQTNKQKN